ncbi:phage tail tape measure protein [Rhizobium halophytocola]|uniref:TP901 family phage tail tape measure protein n=1 Tax=Rhizobium halophytocola TaxID=735519 RepID=A0ABS4E2H5_9HYPH|nr:phage tail tape measure protein [Rhizobium halophytocola]MBP1852109.1 TP901 family phage tail tape measure protein [Rhizobium halophytocola]
MSVLTSRLIISLLDRASAPARAVATSIDRMHSRIEANNKRIGEMRGRMVEAGAVAYGLAHAISAPVKAAMAFESSMADIRKVVDFDGEGSFKAMGEQIRALSLRMPMTADGIAQIVAAAGQSGVANDELLRFAEVAAKVGTAWDISASETGEALAKLKTALGRSVADTESLADAINYLGNNSAASAPQILQVVKRVAPMASQFGMTAEQVAAIGAAMTGAGFEAEVASTSLLNVGRALTKGASATKRQEAVFDKLGLSATNVAKRMQKDAVGTLQDVLLKINKLPAATRAAAISDLFGDEARALGPLISNGKLLSDVLAMVADKANYAGSANQEFETASKRTANSMALFNNRMTDLAVSIGDALLPALNQIVDVLGPIVTTLSDLAQRYPHLTTAIVATTAALVAFRIASLAASFSFAWMRGGMLLAGLGGLRALKLAISGVGLVAAPFGMAMKAARTGLVGFAAASSVAGIGPTLKIMATGLMSALNPLRLVRLALVGLRVALIGSGIGIALLAIGAAGAWIYNNWQGISSAFAAFGQAFMKAIEPVMPMIQPVIDGLSELFNWIGDLLGPVDQMSGSWAGWGAAAGKAVGDVIVAVVGLPAKILAVAQDMAAAGASLIQSLWDGAVAKFDAFIAWVGAIPRRIRDAIGSINLSNVISLPKLPSWLGGRPAPPAPPVAHGARAAGGPIVGGRTYLVGEEGPEMITASRSGYVHNARQTAGMMPPGSGPTVNIKMILNGITDPGQIADQLIAILNRRLKSEINGLQGDLGYGVA